MWTLWLPQHSWHNFRSQLQTFTWHRTSASLMMCNVLKLPVLKSKRDAANCHLLSSNARWNRWAVLATWRERRKGRKKMREKEKGKAWFAKTGWLTKRLLLWVKKKIFKGGEKSKTKKCISTEKIGGVWGSVLFLVWAGESPVRAICPCESNRKSQTVSASKKKREKKKEEMKRCHRGVGSRKRRERGQVGIVSRVSLSIHSPWFLFGLLGETVTEEGVRNVLLLRCCHQQTEEVLYAVACKDEGIQSW